MTIYYEVDEHGIYQGQSDVEPKFFTLVPYPDKNALYYWREVDQKWQFVFGVTSTGKVTLNPGSCRDYVPDVEQFEVSSVPSLTSEVSIASGDKGSVVMKLDGRYMGQLGELPPMVSPLQGSLSGRVCLVGLGPGNDARALDNLASVTAFDVVEINPEVIAESDRFGSIAWAKGQLVTDDMADYIQRPGTPLYDAILSDTEDAAKAHCAALFMLEHLQRCKAKLDPGGLLAYRRYFFGAANEEIFKNTLLTLFNFVGTIDEVIVASDTVQLGTPWLATDTPINSSDTLVLSPAVQAAKDTWVQGMHYDLDPSY